MPNWTVNRMRIHRDDQDLIINDEGDADLGILRPMPKSLDIGVSSDCVNEFAIKAYRGEVSSFGDEADRLSCRLEYTIGETGEERVIENPTMGDYADLGAILASNIERYGAIDWYDWCRRHWGTKWNAQDSEVSDNGDGYLDVCFKTAWCAPSVGLLEELEAACSHPLVFECSYEDDGYETVYDAHRHELRAEDVSLFDCLHYDGTGALITADEFARLVEDGKDCWVEWF